MHLLIATRNPGKIREFREILGQDRFIWDDLSGHPDLQPPAENGRTFRANACLKAAYYATMTGVYALADDSGLEVDALGGAPGIHSSRWAQMHGAGQGDTANNMLLLRQLQDVPEAKRTARFICVLALADPQGRVILTAQDAVEGQILRQPRGSNGFGYDPLFLVAGLQRTAAEMPAEQKHQVSHRGKALRRMRDLMERMFGRPDCGGSLTFG